MAVVYPGSCSSDWTPSLGLSIQLTFSGQCFPLLAKPKIIDQFVRLLKTHFHKLFFFFLKKLKFHENRE